MAIDTHPTAASIAAAKQHQAEERQRVLARTGLRITDAGVQMAPYRIHCPRPGCRYAASARSEGQAVRSLGTHLVRAHLQEGR